MKKKDILWRTIKYYQIIPMLLFAVAIYFSMSYITDFLFASLSIHRQEYDSVILNRWAPVAVWGFYGYICFSIIRSRKYKYLTGRSYDYDHSHYNRTYTHLVDYFKNAEPHKLDTSLYPEASWQDTKGLIFGKDRNRLISIPSASECNLAIFGPPGSGKTSGFAIISAMQFEGSVLAVDIKGDIYNYVHSHSTRKILRFAPDAKDALSISCHFDPLHGFDKMSPTDQKLYLDHMASVLIADEGGNEGNYFTSRARKLFQGIAHLMLFKDPNTSFPDIIHAILEGDVFTWVTEAIGSDCRPSKELLASFYGNNEKNVSGAYDALTTALISFSNPVLDELLSRSDKSISIDNLENGYDIYLQISQEHLDAYAPLFTLLIQNFSTAFTKRPDNSTGVKNRPILMLMDEFPQLTFSYQMINSNLSTLRSRAIICVLIQQNLSQLNYRYGAEGARALLGNCNYQLILGSNDIISSEQFSKTFGTKRILKVSNSVNHTSQSSSSRSVQETETRVYPPEYFGDLPSTAKMIVYFKGKYCELTKLNCYK